MLVVVDRNCHTITYHNRDFCEYAYSKLRYKVVRILNSLTPTVAKWVHQASCVRPG